MERSWAYSKRCYAGQHRSRAGRGWPLDHIVCISACGGLRGRDPLRAAVVPIRQFCRIEPPDALARTASFPYLDVSGFSDLSGGRHYEHGRCMLAEGSAAVRQLPYIPAGRVLPLEHGEPPAGVRELYLQEALDDEADALLDSAYGSGGIEVDMWVDGGTGGDARGGSTSGGGGAGLTCKGLRAARKKIADHNFNEDYVVCCTTPGALAGLKRDPEFAEGGRFLKSAAGSAANIRDIVLVAAPAPAGGGPGERGRSVMFVPNVSLGLISDDTVTVTSELDGGGGLRLAAHHMVGGVVIAADSVCGILHA